MKALLLCLCLAPTPLAPSAIAAPAQEDAATDAGAAAELPDATEWSRAFVEHWPEATYTIRRGERELGTYTQTNRLETLRDRQVLVFSDAVVTPGSDGYRAQSNHTLAAGLPTRSFQASTGDVDGIKLAFTGGRMQGLALMKRPVDLEVPKRFVTEIALLRGAPRVAAEKGAVAQLDYIDIETLPDAASVSTGSLRCQGQHEIELGGETRMAWKYRWEPEGKRPTFFYYGDHGELLRREYRKEVWELKTDE